MLTDYLHRGFRRIVGRPALGLTTVVLLGLGIGLACATFAILDALIFRPLPFTRPEQLAQVYLGTHRGGRITVPQYILQAWRDSGAFAAVEGVAPSEALAERSGDSVSVPMARITPGLFAMLGDVTPLRGRLFEPSEGAVGNDGVVVVSEEFWRSHFGTSPALVGSRIMVDQESLLVVGILPSDFRFPAFKTAIWRPSHFRGEVQAQAYVRFRPDRPAPDALRLATDAARGAGAGSEMSARTRPLGVLALDPFYKRAVPFLGGGVILVFIVLCTNASSLRIANLMSRSREFRTCAALGASRRQLVAEAVVENALLSTVACLVGLGVASLLISACQAMLLDGLGLQTLNPPNVDFRVLSVASLLAGMALFLSGVLPISLTVRVGGDASLRASEFGSSESRRMRALRAGLVVSEIAAACVLLLGAALLIQSFVKLARTDRGLDVRGVMTARISFPKTAFPQAESRLAVARELELQARHFPGVSQVAWSYGLPPDAANFSEGVWRPDGQGSEGVRLTVDRYRVAADFFRLYRIPLLGGRYFEPTDGAGDVIVGERFARIMWPEIDPVGRAFSWNGEQFRVIGIVSEINYPSLDAKLDRTEFYEPFRTVGSYSMMSIRCSAGCLNATSLRQQLKGAHASISVEVREPEQAYFAQLAKPRVAAALAFAFALIASVAAVSGLFALLNYAVSRRRREFGIRMALGASPRQVRWLLVRHGLALALVGVAIGAFGALPMSRVLSSLQYGIGFYDVRTWASILSLIVLVSVAASWWPARDAGRTNVARLLREE